MKHLVKGAARRLRRVLPRKARPAILMYHRIATETFDPWGLAVEEERFSDQIEWLSRHREVIPLGEFAERQRERCLPPSAVALTFDDGYACAAKALSHLERLNLPATVFVAPDLIERGREFWWDELQRILLHFDGDALSLLGKDIAVPERTDHDWIWQPGAPPRTPRQAIFQSIWSSLRTKAPAELDAAMSELRSQSGAAPPRDSHRPLNAGEIRAAKSKIVSFGSHALTHPSLPALSKAEKLHEILDSRSRCAQLTGVIPTTFAYPYGNLDSESVRMVRDAGFESACSTAGDFVTRRSEPFALPRLQVGNWDVSRLADMLAGR